MSGHKCLTTWLCTLILLGTALSGCTELGGPVTIVSPANVTPLDTFAAREIHRYLYQRTGKLVPIVKESISGPPRGDLIIIGSWTIVSRSDKESIGLAPGQYLIRTQNINGRRIVTIIGGDSIGTLYGAYRFAEHLGVRFYLHGDVIPDEQMELKLPEINENGNPLFSRRGIQPFHDFPEGPDWWSLDGYKAIIAQLPKLRMNFIGLHTYPEGGVGPEPVVWIGSPDDVGPGGQVKFSYPSRHFSTVNNTWGYQAADPAQSTSGYYYGASQLFEHEQYCQDVQVGMTPWPATPEACNTFFNRFADKLRKAFEFARVLGVKTCVGTEVPLVVPKEVRARLGPDTGPIQALGGSIANYGGQIAETDDGTLYQSVRWNMDGYRFNLPNGAYKVTLKFAEIHYEAAGKRIFGVVLQGKLVIDKLDIFDKVGKNKALNFTFEDVQVTNGQIAIDFVKEVEYPCVSAIAVEGVNKTLKVNCGGQAYKDYIADEEHPVSSKDILKLYEGIFTRIMKAYPIDYYWFWTPEGWTWSNIAEAQVKDAMDDVRLAMAAAKKVNAPFKLATCGWVLGPQYDRSLFDRELPKDMPMSCISRAVGHDPVEPGFAKVSGRPKWAIPWLEDDPALASPQLWAGRMRKDAADALDYGCTGLMGIHWRTRVLSPNISALAQAAWSQTGWRRPTSRPSVTQDSESKPASTRFLPTDDFYKDWATIEFGQLAGERAGILFAKIDGHLPRPVDWIDGPGHAKPDSRPWDQAAKDYTFVEEMEAIRPLIQDPGNLERFDYWLNQFRYMKTVAQVNCLYTQFEESMKKVDAESDPERKKQLARDYALPLRKQLVQIVGEIYRLLLATVSNTGEMGTIANWQQHSIPTYIQKPGEALAKAMGEALPEDAQPGTAYLGPPRVFVPEVRTCLAAGETLTVKVTILDRDKPQKAGLYWRTMGKGNFAAIPLKQIARGVWTVQLPSYATWQDALEYYIEVRSSTGDALVWPPTAPKLNQTVVVIPKGS